VFVVAARFDFNALQLIAVQRSLFQLLREASGGVRHRFG
jgi:hypothetical protein